MSISGIRGAECFAVLASVLARIGRREDFRQRDDWGRQPRWEETGWRSRMPRSMPVSYTGAILIACVVIFFLSLIVPGLIFNYLALNTDLVMQRPWTLITYMFVHGSFDHLFWNMLFLFFFGIELEKRVGERRFLEIYMLSGIVAALGQMLFAGGVLVGASGALYGVLGCLAIIAPEIRILLFFILPISIRWAVVLFAGIDFLSLGTMDNIAHMAHIIGLFVGLAYGRLMQGRPKYYYNL